jgi:hypothetical protein
LIRPSCSSDFAQTTKTSAIAELVIHISRRRADSRRRSSVPCAHRAGVEPASGSVRPKQPTHSPVASLGRYFRRCASVP